MSLTASARSISGSLAQAVDVNSRHEIVTDEPTSLGGTDAGPAPHELMAAMLAACVSTTLVLYARRHAWQLKDVRVDVVYDPDTSPRHVELTVHLPGDLSADQLARLLRVAGRCPVRRALEAGFEFEERLAADLPVAA
jgi:putative redox protein